MISLPIQDAKGKKVGTYKFDPNELASKVNKQLLHDVVVMYEASRRVGTVRTKSRGDVEGSTKKLFRQKGTGRARAGGSRTPVRRGGGHTFAKKPVDWSFRLPKKAVRLATRMALLSKFLDEQVVVLDELSIDAPKTKTMAELLNSLKLGKESCLLAIEEHDENIWMSSRNLPNLRVAPALNLNAYDLLHQRRFLVTKAALDRLRENNESSKSSREKENAKS